ncbi:MAG TPA: GxxExxY protein, partial [Candidatus Absconditabacterales bacterium]|nr:GxxExxY protein [Candidatus Absconditabacterales bacterium]
EVYIGVPFTSLRMRQNKVKDFEVLKKTIQAIHNNGAKALLTMNIFPRNTDIKVFESVVEKISDTNPDAIIFSDPGTFNILRKHFPNVPLHLSTQASTLNYESIKFWRDLGVKRIILARELHIDEIKEIKKHVPDIELEIFVHGAMCMSYSGRCLLGDYMSGRQANKGECSHACRFKYKVWLEEERRPGKLFQLDNDKDGSYILSSKDLCTINRLAEILPYVDALKIEGRSKSEFYVGAMVKAYKEARDAILEGREPNLQAKELVEKIPHRPYWDGFLFNKLTNFPEGEEVGAISDDGTMADNKGIISDDRGKDESSYLNREYDKLTFDIIGIAMNVHNQLGPGLLEKVYSKGLISELKKKGYDVKKEQRVEYKINDDVVGTGYVDLIINDVVALELKSTKVTKGDYYKQLRSYTKNNENIKVGFIFNFYNKKLDFKRLDKSHPGPSNGLSDGISSGLSGGLSGGLSDIVHNHQTSTSLTTPGPVFCRNYFGIFKENFIEKNGKKYFEFNPKEVLERGMKLNFLSSDGMGELKIIDIIKEGGQELEKATCNTPKVFILTDKELKGREILYE